MKMIFLISLLFVFVSCSSKNPETKAKIKLAAATAEFPGELYVVGKKDTGEMFAYRLNENTRTVSLPNGDWNFMAFGWEGSDRFSGELQCGHTFKNLNGGEINLDIVLSYENCLDQKFGPLDTKDEFGFFYPVEFHTCSGMQTKFNVSPNDFFNMENEGFGNCEEHPGLAKSFRIELYEFDITKNPDAQKKNPIASVCSDDVFDTLMPFASSEIKIPAFDPNYFKFPIKVIAYDGLGCTSTSEFKMFPNGLMQPHPQYALFSIAEQMVQKIVFDSNNCRGANLAASPFANGDFAYPPAKNIICTPAQLFAIDNDYGAYLDGDFALGANINLAGFSENDGDSDDQIYYAGDKFEGKFEGGGFKISNYVKTFGSSAEGGLFKVIGQAEFNDIILENFTISESGSAASVGLLAGKMDLAGAMPEQIKLGITLIDNDINTPTSSCIGGIIGYVNGFNNSNSDEISIFAKLDGRYSNNVFIAGSGNNFTGDDQIGGLVGCANFDNFDFLRVERSNINRTFLTGSMKMGGLIGSTSFIESRSNNINVGFTVLPTAANYVEYGGIAGVATKIQSTDNLVTANFNFDNDSAPNNIDIDKLGGVVGNSDEARIVGDVVNITVTQTGAELFTTIGGIAGMLNSGGGGHLVQNTSANVTFTTDGWNQGGIVGFVGDPAEIKGNLAKGNINQSSPIIGSNMTRGGIAGVAYANGNVTNIKNNISYVNVSSNSIVGGLVGSLQGALVQENYANGVITSTGGDQLGGLVGSVDNSVTSEVRSSVFDGVLVSTVSCLGGTCKYLIGNSTNVNCSSNIDGLIASTASSLTVNGSSIPKSIGAMIGDAASCTWSTGVNESIFFGDAACDVATNNSLGDIDCAVFPAFIDVSGVAKLKFHEDWKSIATIVSGKIQNVGSGADPFLLSDPNQWNAVASKDFLMSKSFKLMDDLDFDLADTISVPGGSTKFIPFGGHPDNIDGVAPTVVPFTGNLIANGKKLINIDITSGQNDAQDIGVFRKVGVGGSGGFPTIGYSDDPLVIENLTIDLTTYESNNVGAIGTLENGMANVRVINGNITGSVTPGISSAVGGVVGNVMDGKIMHSSYQGNIDVSGYASVGGIVGFIDGFSSIEKSYSELNTLVGYQEVGGIAGMLQGDLRIQFVYARLKGAIGESGSTQIGGFYGAQGVSSGNYSDILIDYFGNSSLFTNVGGCTNECFAIAQDLGGATAVNIIALTDLNANDSVNIDTSNTIGDNIYIESSAATLNENVYGPFISNSYDAWNWYIVNDQAGTPRLKLKFESGVYW